MTLAEHLKTLKTVTIEQIESKEVILQQDEFLLYCEPHQDSTGFMISRINQNGEIPKSFKDWGQRYNYNTKQYEKGTMYILKEEYRSGWKFLGMRHGKSAAWVRLKHPFGFHVEINQKAFESISQKITMVDGTIVTPCYFAGAMKNAALLVNENDNSTLMYQIQQKVSENPEFREKFRDLMIENFPAITFEVLI